MYKIKPMTLSCKTKFHIVTKNLGMKLTILVAITILVGGITIASLRPVREQLTILLMSLRALPPSESIPILFALYAIANAPTMLPTTALHATCGILFGLYHGSLIALGCYTVTAFFPYILVRHCCQERVNAWLSPYKYYALISVINDRPLFMLLCTRSSPVVPGSLNNALFGLCHIHPCTYVLGSAVGIAPQLVFYTYCGTLISDLSELSSLLTGASVEKVVLLALGGEVTVVMLVYMAIKANHVINQNLDPAINNNNNSRGASQQRPQHSTLVEVIAE